METEITPQPIKGKSDKDLGERDGTELRPLESGSSGKDRDEDPGRQGVVVDAVWGEIDDSGPNYRNLGW